MLLSKFFNIEVEAGDPLKLFDNRGNVVYMEDSHGGWIRNEYDSNNREVYYEDDNGHIIDNRSEKSEPAVEMTMAQICEELGKEVKIVE